MSRKIIQFTDTCRQLYSDCGYSPDSSTLLHQKIPAIAGVVRHRDAVVTAGEPDGSAAAAMLLLLLRNRSRLLRNRSRLQRKPQEPHPHQLLLVEKHTLESLNKLLENSRLSADRLSADRLSADRPCPVTFLGTNADSRKDIPLLQSCRGLLAAVPDQLIDHVRRDNIRLDRIENAAIIIPDHREYRTPENGITDERAALESFEQDVRYIFTKFSSHPRTTLFTPEEVEENHTGLRDLLIRPKRISRSDWRMAKRELTVGSFPVLSPETVINFITSSLPIKRSRLPSMRFRLSEERTIIICNTEEERHLLEAALRQVHQESSPKGLLKIILSGETDFSWPGERMKPPSTVILYGLRGDPEESAAVVSLLVKAKKADFFCFTTAETRETREFSQKLEGYFTMKRTLEKNQRQESPAVKKLQELVKNIRGDKNPTELQEIRALIRKHVPFSMRTFLAAYLLREQLDGSSDTSPGSLAARSSSDKKPAKASGKPEKKAADAKKNKAQKESGRKDGTTLFVGIGKKRRIYPKDLARLFQAVEGIGDEDILSIKILENYSFVTVSNEAADKAVAGINGTEFRGKPVTCDYARKKD